MKYIKTYEELNWQPKVGDFVKIDKDGWTPTGPDDDINILKKFFDDEIGLIIRIKDRSDHDYDYPYLVKFITNVPYDNANSNEMSFSISEIKRPATPKEIEEYHIKMDSNKYNL